MAESTLAWLDLDEAGRRKMQETLDLLREPTTLDELGIGQIRDAFAGIFFPGTSTLWSRARYTLFVPWLYQRLEIDGTRGIPGRDAARGLQRRLISAQRRADDTTGLIGSRTAEPVRMPDELLWNGLKIWGIRVREGSLSRCHRELERGVESQFTLQRGEGGELVSLETGSWWHPDLPPAPERILEEAAFDLNREEAEFVRAQLGDTRPDSILARAVADDPIETSGLGLLWESPEVLERLTDEVRGAVDLARRFAEAMQGAGLLYSLFVTRLKDPESDAVDELDERFQEWTSSLTERGVKSELADWSVTRTEFWPLVRAENSGIGQRTQRFVDRWMELLQRPGLPASDEAFELMRRREHDIKGPLAALSNKKARDNAKGESTTGLLQYRWPQAKSICADITRGLRSEQ